jgi:hypothetical protein
MSEGVGEGNKDTESVRSTRCKRPCLLTRVHKEAFLAWHLRAPADCSCLLPPVCLQTEFVDQSVQIRTADPESSRRSHFVPILRFECVYYQLLL